MQQNGCIPYTIMKKKPLLAKCLEKKYAPQVPTSVFLFLFCYFENLVIMTQQQREYAAKWLHTENFNKTFQRVLSVLSHEIKSWQLNDAPYFCTNLVLRVLNTLVQRNSSFAKNLIDLFGLKVDSQNLLDLLNNLAGLKHFGSEGYPRRLCRKCYKELRFFRLQVVSPTHC